MENTYIPPRYSKAMRIGTIAASMLVILVLLVGCGGKQAMEKPMDKEVEKPVPVKAEPEPAKETQEPAPVQEASDVSFGELGNIEEELDVSEFADLEAELAALEDLEI